MNSWNKTAKVDQYWIFRLITLNLDITHLLVEPEGPAQKQPKKPDVVRAENAETGVKVKQGKVHKVHPQQARNEEAHQLKLKEMLIPKRHRRPYEKIKFGKKRQEKEVRKMIEKRKKLNDNEPKEEVTIA